MSRNEIKESFHEALIFCLIKLLVYEDVCGKGGGGGRLTPFNARPCNLCSYVRMRRRTRVCLPRCAHAWASVFANKRHGAQKVKTMSARTRPSPCGTQRFRKNQKDEEKKHYRMTFLSEKTKTKKKREPTQARQ